MLSFRRLLVLLSTSLLAAISAFAAANIPYWENMFPTATGVNLGSCLPGDTVPATPTATQAMYELYICNIGPATFGETNALDIADAFCAPGCATINGQVTPFAYHSPQYSALYAWSSVANSSYHAAQLVLRSRQKHGLQFDLNYTYSHSIEEGSDAERVGTFGGLSAIINTWAPQQLRVDSDFDARHQINANWVYEMPFGRGKWMGADWGRLTDSFLGVQLVKFSAEIFNLTNSARFDVALNVNTQNAATFGQYGGLLTKPRVMQFALRYEF